MKKRISARQYIIGVDEAGRGPLAGPVAVGVACVQCGFDWEQIPGVGDSKKIAEKNREAIFLRAKELRSKKKLNFAVVLISAKTIDTIGISRAVERGINKALEKLSVDPKHTVVLLDGLLKAPIQYTNQETIIKGDAQEKIIGLASICAKVTRDHYMEKIASECPLYHFEVHKGYGTLIHRLAIQMFGLSKYHRESYCKNILRTKM